MDWESKENIQDIVSKMRGPIREAAAKLTISEQQKGSLRTSIIKGPIWVANFSLAFPPEDSIRIVLLEVIDKFNDQRVSYTRPISTPINLEWVGFRKGVGKDEPQPQISELEKYHGLMGDATGSGVVFFVYGGAFYMNNQATYRKVTSRLSAMTGLPCVTCHQRLAPQNPFPAALLDVFHGYLALLSPPSGAPHLPTPASSIVIAGESAGGCLAMGLLQVLLELKRMGKTAIQHHGRTVKLALPAGLTILSGVAELTNALPSHEYNNSWDMIPPSPQASTLSGFPPCEIWPSTPPRGNVYCEVPMMSHPIVAPMMAKDWTGSPPLWFVSGQEQIIDAVKVLVRIAASQNVPVFLQEYEAMPHCFMWRLGDSPQSRKCWEDWASACRKLARGEAFSMGAEIVHAKGLKTIAVNFEELTKSSIEEAHKIITEISKDYSVFTGQRGVGTKL